VTDRFDVDVGYRDPLDRPDETPDDERPTRAELEREARCHEPELDADTATMLDEAIAWAVRGGGGPVGLYPRAASDCAAREGGGT
jgi:hypothetical protein